MHFYTILIMGKTGDYYEDTLDCDGSNPLIINQTYCDVPLSSLRSDPYDLLQGDLIQATITATNTYGTSPISIVNT